MPEPDETEYVEQPSASEGTPDSARAAEPIADDVLLASASLAQRALLETTPPETVGSVIGHIVEGDRVLTLLFAADLPGYRGWHWSVTIARVDDGEPTVLETELMPGEQALLAPEWVPWSERLADYRAAQAAAEAAAETEERDGSGDDGSGDGSGDGADAGDDLDDDALGDADGYESEFDDEFDDDDDDHDDDDHADDVFDGIDIDALDDSPSDDEADDEDAGDDAADGEEPGDDEGPQRPDDA
ncbi:DUF3027 domain-containing protein [Agromyces sp. CFH 90414]|uniref:DUF3027 domain-containing protein n=1 Tax=Agromyces agglutinans TaxID=2662258 RepID=A0A6I2F6A8_9MICO|nr:DUF3027 domain-containing protein [Agromyces agglutinans]MRG61005.1 DUF3027 domain-containing protein [Agromyces agglutinans]